MRLQLIKSLLIVVLVILYNTWNELWLYYIICFKTKYNIKLKLGDTAISCANYALLTDKTQQSYEELLQALVDRASDLGFTLDPRDVHLDFEKSAQNAVTNFLGTHVHPSGCKIKSKKNVYVLLKWGIFVTPEGLVFEGFL